MARLSAVQTRAKSASSARPIQAASEHALLTLQRRVGNAAVKRLVQRKIGFELESGLWQAAALDGEPTQKHREEKSIPKGVKTKPPQAREAFYADGGVRGTADELPGGVRDVEFVITELDESDGKEIGKRFDQVDKLFKRIGDATSEDSWVWPEARFGWKPPTAHTWLLDKEGGGETLVQMQATAGMPLDQLAETGRRLDDESHKRELTLDETGIHPAAAEMVIAPAQAAARAALADFNRVYGGLGDADALLGMLILMAQFLIGGTPAPGEEKSPAFSYPKAIATLLPRTDFATMFTTLPEEHQKVLKKVDPVLNRTRFAGLIFLLSKHTSLPGLDVPVFGYQAWKQISDKAVVTDLTRRAWADGIVGGQDRITSSGYLSWLDERKGEIGATTHGDRKKQAAQLDSIGAYGKKMDKGTTEDLPLVEFRALVNGEQSMFMTVSEAKAVGLALAAYVHKMATRTL